MTPLQTLYADWADCQRCHLAETRKRVVMVRGEVPCDVLMVGEAPAHTEDVLGIPFTGPVGHLQNGIIAEAVPDGVSWCLANVIGCIPLGEDGKKLSKPDDVSVQKCTPRLQEIVRLCDPKLIVCLGEVAEHYLMTSKYIRIPLHRDDIPMVHVLHPSAIGRAKIVQQGLMRQRTVVQIGDAIEKYVLNRE